tara:strand:- start:262 stop:486 length:225 start_codon:yes stop_codon:yes gene_type:complete
MPNTCLIDTSSLKIRLEDKRIRMEVHINEAGNALDILITFITFNHIISPTTFNRPPEKIIKSIFIGSLALIPNL